MHGGNLKLRKIVFIQPVQTADF